MCMPMLRILGANLNHSLFLNYGLASSRTSSPEIVDLSLVLIYFQAFYHLLHITRRRESRHPIGYF